MCRYEHLILQPVLTIIIFMFDFLVIISNLKKNPARFIRTDEKLSSFMIITQIFLIDVGNFDVFQKENDCNFLRLNCRPVLAKVIGRAVFKQSKQIIFSLVILEYFRERENGISSYWYHQIGIYVCKTFDIYEIFVIFNSIGKNVYFYF